MKFLALLLLISTAAFAPSALAETGHTYTGKVISQEIGAYNGGSAVMPLGSGLVGIPIMRRSNIIVIQTAGHRITASELRNKHFLLLSVNDEVTFSSDKTGIEILDSKGKKHKFVVLHLETIGPNK